MTASWRRLREHVLLGENTSLLVLNHNLVTNEIILWDDDDGDHVPELGVMSVHEHVQLLQEDIKIRTHVNKVCSV